MENCSRALRIRCKAQACLHFLDRYDDDHEDHCGHDDHEDEEADDYEGVCAFVSGIAKLSVDSSSRVIICVLTTCTFCAKSRAHPCALFLVSAEKGAR